jgi:hypothetical protein
VEREAEEDEDMVTAKENKSKYDIVLALIQQAGRAYQGKIRLYFGGRKMNQRKEEELLERLDRIEKRASRLLAGIKLLVDPAVNSEYEAMAFDADLGEVLKLKAVALELKRDTMNLQTRVIAALHSRTDPPSRLRSPGRVERIGEAGTKLPGPL